MDLPSEAVSKCFSFRCFYIYGILPFRVLTNNAYTTVYTILFMNLIMISGTSMK